MNKKALGRGLSTLLPARPQPSEAPAPEPVQATLTELEIDRIVPNPFQPRISFDETALQELAQSIRSEGIIQPLVVRPADGGFQLIAGERRWRAAQIAGLERVPVHVQHIPDERMLEIALIENLQREDLNPIESSLAFHRLSEHLGLSHEEIGQRTGKDRATISNSIRLLQLPGDVQHLISERKLSAGHARALLKLQDPDVISDVADKTVREQWSVRQLERITADYHAEPGPKTSKPQAASDPNVRAAIDDLERVLGARVRILPKARGRGGRVEIEYYSPEDLDRIYTTIVREES